MHFDMTCKPGQQPQQYKKAGSGQVLAELPVRGGRLRVFPAAV